jgi:[ribosomal protein S5]-alanine N-acetyltransferase
MLATIYTDRLMLRPFNMDDADGMFRLDSDPRVHFFLGNQPVTHISQSREVIRNVTAQYTENGIGRWAAVLRSTGEFIGWSGLKLVTEGTELYYDVGYRLIPEFWGQGYATESANAAIRYGFDIMGLTTIIGTAHQDNKASISVLKKCGLTFRKKYMWRDILCDWMDITADEWKKIPE